MKKLQLLIRVCKFADIKTLANVMCVCVSACQLVAIETRRRTACNKIIINNFDIYLKGFHVSCRKLKKMFANFTARILNMSRNGVCITTETWPHLTQECGKALLRIYDSSNAHEIRAIEASLLIRIGHPSFMYATKLSLLRPNALFDDVAKFISSYNLCVKLYLDKMHILHTDLFNARMRVHVASAAVSRLHNIHRASYKIQYFKCKRDLDVIRLQKNNCFK